MPDKATVIRWLAKDAVLRAKYAHAREVQRHVWADEIADLAKSEPARNPATGRIDWASVRHIRNQVATLRWLAVKLNSKKCGDKLAVGGDSTQPCAQATTSSKFAP